MLVTSSEEQVLHVKRLDLHGAIDTARGLEALPEAPVYVIDFSALEWTEPFGLLFFARKLRKFADSRKPSRCRAINYQEHGYAAHMGFFQSFGLGFGKDPGEALGSTRYVPITSMRIEDLEREAASDYVDVRDTIEARCASLATVLTHSEGGDLQHTLGYSLREIFRNVLEHSQADTIWYAAQYWPTKGLVELSILDEGIGVRQSLSRNPHLNIHDDEDALRYALLPGVSGVAFRGGPRQRRDEWANSGYGLFMTSQICARGGNFVICSGTSGIMLENGEQKSLAVDIAGTALRLQIHVPEIRALNEALEDLRKRGTSIAGELRHTVNLTASMSSRMLSKDFSQKG
ncbi:hypothetical protein LMG28614_02239 [Paraburkholderia ultramafica]|uniref:Uncharacterized protein n=1 Tax=Paraburkholderia ultramafica TaxID=1544867 RepID=A0A6S7BBX8_9BURK|nr:ATP-binding protein [Paraburkholderia ultramafica]CAB3785923.1 hypothetical protein LMG28614_02239 [Paraburkholderia ultramafica]